MSPNASRNAEIVRLRDGGMLYSAIADRLGISKGCVSSVLRHAGRTVSQRRYSHTASRPKKLTASAAAEIRRRHAAGETQVGLAEEFSVHPTAVWAIVHNRCWKQAA